MGSKYEIPQLIQYDIDVKATIAGGIIGYISYLKGNDIPDDVAYLAKENSKGFSFYANIDGTVAGYLHTGGIVGSINNKDLFLNSILDRSGARFSSEFELTSLHKEYYSSFYEVYSLGEEAEDEIGLPLLE